MLVIWGPEQCRVHAADWHDGQISHNTHSKIARRAADPISACRYRKPHWVRDNIARDFAIQELAEAVALAPRTFARRVPATCGVSPIQFVQQIRLETADHPPVGRADRPAGRICGTLDASQADPARHQAFVPSPESFFLLSRHAFCPPPLGSGAAALDIIGQAPALPGPQIGRLVDPPADFGWTIPG